MNKSAKVLYNLIAISIFFLLLKSSLGGAQIYILGVIINFLYDYIFKNYKSEEADETMEMAKEFFNENIITYIRIAINLTSWIGTFITLAIVSFKNDNH